MNITHITIQVEKHIKHVEAMLEVMAARIAILESKIENTASVEEMTALVNAAVSDE